MNNEDTNGKKIIIVNKLWFYRNDNLVLEDINLLVDEGIFLGLIGPNGGGKTTLLKILLGLLKPTKGNVQILGKSVERLKDDITNIGYVPQRTVIDWNFPASVLDVVVMGISGKIGLFKPITKEMKRKAIEILEMVGIGNLSNNQIGKLSIGQQQRAFLARALMVNPKILILDEPTSNVDTGGQEQFLTLIKNLKDNMDLTIIMVSHDIGQLVYYADQLACLNKRIHWHDKSHLLDQDVIEKVYCCELNNYYQRHKELCVKKLQ